MTVGALGGERRVIVVDCILDRVGGFLFLDDIILFLNLHVFLGVLNQDGIGGLALGLD
jgi:hypothetical protein